MQTSTNCDNSLEILNSAHQATGAVQMRIKNANSHQDRQSQTKSMILTDAGKVTEPVSQMPQTCCSLLADRFKKKNTAN